jgi:hypothetical protein
MTEATQPHGDVGNRLGNAFRAICWPNGSLPRETRFNKESLLSLLQRASDLASLEDVPEKGQRRENAKPFFGASALASNLSVVHWRSRTDLVAKWNGTFIFVENKIIRAARECDIKNALVQAVEYLGLYNVSLAVVLVFDQGRAKDREWDTNSSEYALIACLARRYPILVVRVREGHNTCVLPEGSESGQPNQTSEATSEPAPGAGSSAPQG